MNIFVQMLILVVAFAGFLSKPFITVYSPQAGSQTVKGYETYTYDAVLESTVSMKINSSFDQKEIRITESIPFETEYIDDPEREYGLEETIEEGILGNTTYIYEAAYWHDEEISRTLIDTQVEEPKNEVISVGKKVIWREIDTEYGELKYWRKIHVWATKYDGNCEGCRGLTYSGTLVRKGVCAVDPKVISLGTNFYVDGYGMCRSEDIGGGIKGNEVDLGYEDVTKGDWRTGWTDVYLLTSFPTD